MNLVKIILFLYLSLLASCSTINNGSLFKISSNNSSKYIDNNLILYFDFDSYQLKESSKNFIGTNIIDLLVKNPNLSIVIAGHADERGTKKYNYHLGKNRANEVRKYLLANNIKDSRIKVVSYGETMPADPKSNEKAWKQNRRAVITIAKKAKIL